MWRASLRRARFRIEVMDDIGPERFVEPGVADVLAARRLTRYLQHCFTTEGRHHA